MLPKTAVVAFHLSINLVTYQIYWNDSSIRQDKKISLIKKYYDQNNLFIMKSTF